MLSAVPTPLEELLQHSDEFIRGIFSRSGKTKAVIAVSGGIDSAVALSLVVRALGSESVVAVSLPYGQQDMTDAHTIMNHVGLSVEAQLEYNIEPMVSASAQVVGLAAAPMTTQTQLRLGNLMARSRMMVVFDLAKKLDALVAGTENKSEHYLGYFTRFGDAASDFEPIAHLYKTQVRQVAQELGLPSIFVTKPPSAGLWAGQTDETELGFPYAVADQILVELIDRHIPRTSLAAVTGLSQEVITAVLSQVDQSAFKLAVPYLSAVS